MSDKRSQTVQIRPSIEVDHLVVLESIANERGKHLGQTLEELLLESPSYREKYDRLLDFKGRR